ncbi:hypothetical protein FK521_30755, partial [Klebsiella pneumoniae]|nr:hypothetical protein [Klebsiella pneumoniae]
MSQDIGGKGANQAFGVSINYMDMRQNINVDSINFTGLSLDGRNIDCGKDPVCKHAVNNIFANGPVSLDNAFRSVQVRFPRST